MMNSCDKFANFFMQGTYVCVELDQGLVNKKPHNIKGFKHDVNDAFIHKLMLRAHT